MTFYEKLASGFLLFDLTGRQRKRQRRVLFFNETIPDSGFMGDEASCPRIFWINLFNSKR